MRHDHPGLPMSPARYAELSSAGRWRPAPHLALLNGQLLDVAARRVRRAMCFMSPQHGKSLLATIKFTTWYMGTFPDHHVAVCCYNEEYADTLGQKCRDDMEEFGGEFFGQQIRQDSRSKTKWQLRNQRGSFRAVGIGGALTGRPADLLNIDDPVKDDKDVQSETLRNQAWNWLGSVAMSRLSPIGVAMLTMTPWHYDDVGGRLLARQRDKWQVLRLPGLAEEPEPAERRADREGYAALVGAPDPLGRAPGERLWPDYYPQRHYDDMREGFPDTWESLYMCRPMPKSGGMFRREWFEGAPAAEVPAHVDARVRFWDLAATPGGGDYTVGCLMSRVGDRYIVEDVVRVRLGPTERDALIRATAEADNARHPFDVTTWVEQEPGSAGKTVGEQMVAFLRPYAAHAERVTGKKRVRADGFASACGGSKVGLVRAPWNREFVDELCAFDKGLKDDQVDAASGAFNKIAAAKAGVNDYAWTRPSKVVA